MSKNEKTQKIEKTATTETSAHQPELTALRQEELEPANGGLSALFLRSVASAAAAYGSGGDGSTRLVAHEVAHVVQQRRGR